MLGIELIYKSRCSHPFDELPFFYYKRVIAATHSFRFTVFTEQNCRKEILKIIIIPPSFRHAYIERSLFHDGIISSHPFFYNNVINSRKHLRKSICQGNCVYFTLFATIHYSERSVVDSRMGCSCLKGNYLFHRTNCNNFF